ncbi:S41 family peptidase [Xanthomonas campestris pv. asclepiadis]|nr:S41 family peptidase [Xanthomonas campestris pv. asclepiadis]
MRLTATAARTAPFGAASAQLDAVSLRGQSLLLSGVLATSNASQGATLWMRADDAHGKRLAFESSQTDPVSGTTHASRSIALQVPMDTQKVFIGVVLRGDGMLDVSQLRLTVQPLADAASASAILDVAIPAIREHALHSARIDWTTREPQLRAQAINMREVDAYIAIDALVAQLDDGHSFLMRPSRRHAVEAVAQRERPAMQARLLPSGIAYLEVPGLMTSSKEVSSAYETSLATALDQAAAQASCGWIVDVRNNTGGTMWPMINGLHPLLGDAVLGNFVDAAGKRSPWRARSSARATASLQIDRPVAILIGSRTASAGEMVAISFRGRANTRSFGQPSAGQTTGNRSVELPGGAVLAIAASYTQDRNGHRNDGRLQPDVLLDSQVDMIDAAAQWLRTQACVRSK